MDTVVAVFVKFLTGVINGNQRDHTGYIDI